MKVSKIDCLDGPSFQAHKNCSLVICSPLEELSCSEHRVLCRDMSRPKAFRWRSISTRPGRLRAVRASGYQLGESETVVCQAASLRMHVLPRLGLEPCEVSSRVFLPDANTEAGSVSS